MAEDIGNGISAAGTALQNEIDLWGEYLGGDKWRDMRETINFQNPYIQGAMFIASFLPLGRIFKGLSMLPKLRKLGRGAAGLARGFGGIVRNSKAGKMYAGFIGRRKHWFQPGSGKSKWLKATMRNDLPSTSAPFSRMIKYADENGNRKLIQTGIYDWRGRLVGHVDWKGRHGHGFPPGHPGAGHHSGGGSPIPWDDVPYWWKWL